MVSQSKPDDPSGEANSGSRDAWKRVIREKLLEAIHDGPSTPLTQRDRDEMRKSFGGVTACPRRRQQGRHSEPHPRGPRVPAVVTSRSGPIEIGRRHTVTPDDPESSRKSREFCGYRLPTEAEWEYACRAGTGGLYGGDDDPESLVRIANVADASYKKVTRRATCIRGDDGYAYTAPVGSFEPNAWHLYDMIGNVWEWCDDWYDAKFYQSSPKEDPHNTAMASHRVFRGGSWYDTPGYCRPAYRGRNTPVSRDNGLGFRVAAVQE